MSKIIIKEDKEIEIRTFLISLSSECDLGKMKAYYIFSFLCFCLLFFCFRSVTLLHHLN